MRIFFVVTQEMVIYCKLLSFWDKLEVNVSGCMLVSGIADLFSFQCFEYTMKEFQFILCYKTMWVKIKIIVLTVMEKTST